MDGNVAQQILDEVLPYLEALDTQNAAILHFLKDKGLLTDEQFVPYLDRAANTSNVKWLAARVRISHLLSGLEKEKEQRSEDMKARERKKENGDTAAQQAEALKQPVDKDKHSVKPDAAADGAKHDSAKASNNKDKDKEKSDVPAKTNDGNTDQKADVKKEDAKKENTRKEDSKKDDEKAK